MKKLIYIALFLVAFQSAKTQTFNPVLAGMLQDTMDKYVPMISNIKGMSASIFIPGQGIWKGASGISHAGQNVTSDMLFGIASNTKLFVAVTMLKLQEDNILDLDDPLSQWMPAHANIDPTITIRQLLNHTSGVSDPLFVAPWMDTIKINPTRVFTPEEVLDWVGAPLFPVGTSWGYSNINYILAGMVAKNATGSHISQLMRNYIFNPLNMDSTFYDVEEPEVGTLAHRWFNGVDFNDTSSVGLNSAGGAAGSLFSTASEMAQWYHALMSGQVLNQNSMDDLTSFVNTGLTFTYGLGIENLTLLGHNIYGHNGSTWGYKSKMVYDPCMGVIVCGLSNAFPSGTDAIVALLYKTVVDALPICADVIAGAGNICPGDNSITYTVPPIAGATSYVWTLPSGATGNSNTNSITVDYGMNANSGDITVSGVNQFGQGGTSTLSIIVTNIPTPTVFQNGNVLTSSAAVGNQWYDSNGPIANATNQTYNFTVEDDYYTIVGQLGCTSDTSNIIQATFVGLSKKSSNSSIEVHPNPFTNEFTLEYKLNQEKINFEILNTFGQLIYSGNFTEKAIISTSNFSSGIYLVKLKVGKEVEYKRIMKK